MKLRTWKSEKEAVERTKEAMIRREAKPLSDEVRVDPRLVDHLEQIFPEELPLNEDMNQNTLLHKLMVSKGQEQVLAYIKSLMERA